MGSKPFADDVELEALAYALNEEFGTHLWENCDKAVFRLRALSVREQVALYKFREHAKTLRGDVRLMDG